MAILAEAHHSENNSIGVPALRQPGVQSLYDAKGNEIFAGSWDPRVMFETISRGGFSWHGKTVLEIAANTGGLSVEMARAGAVVTMTEPDPYKNTLNLSRDVLDKIIADEELAITVEERDFFQCRVLPPHDVIVCLGLIYHFRHPQMMLDVLSSMRPGWLFISTQTHASDELAMFNRMSPGIMRKNFYEKTDLALSGWHPTRALFVRMLLSAGFDCVESLTMEDFPKNKKGMTDSSYFRAQLIEPIDINAEMARYYPR